MPERDSRAGQEWHEITPLGPKIRTLLYAASER